MKHTFRKQLSVTVIISFFIAMLPVAVAAQDNLGLVRGFVYSDDGKKPLTDAVVLIRETTSERTYKS